VQGFQLNRTDCNSYREKNCTARNKEAKQFEPPLHRMIAKVNEDIGSKQTAPLYCVILFRQPELLAFFFHKKKFSSIRACICELNFMETNSFSHDLKLEA
jgi:hypothetical protein